jgi:hypothetical protein
MAMHVEIPEPLAGKVERIAKTQGKSPEDVVLDAVAQRVDAFARLSEVLAPVRQRLKELGESEDDAVEYFEQVKHQMRRERRAAGK